MSKRAKAKKLSKEHLKCNNPRKTPSHKTKSHVVKACKDGKEKLIRFGQQGVEGAGKNPKTEKEKAREKERNDTDDVRAAACARASAQPGGRGAAEAPRYRHVRCQHGAALHPARRPPLPAEQPFAAGLPRASSQPSKRSVASVSTVYSASD